MKLNLITKYINLFNKQAYWNNVTKFTRLIKLDGSKTKKKKQGVF